MTDLEKIARAIYGAPLPDGDLLGTLIYESHWTDGPVERGRLQALDICASAARAALTAIRGPSPAVREAMAKEVFAIFRRDQKRQWDDLTVTERECAGQFATIIWGAAIDAALKEKGNDHD